MSNNAGKHLATLSPGIRNLIFSAPCRCLGQSWPHLTQIVLDSSPIRGLTSKILVTFFMVDCDLRHFTGASPFDDSLPLFHPHLVSFKIYQLELNEGLGFLLDLLCCSALRHISIIYGHVDTVLWQSQFKAFFLDCHALWTMLTCREQPVEQCDFLCPNPVVLILHR